MTMFDTVGVDVDWIALKQLREEEKAQAAIHAKREEAIAIAQKMLKRNRSIAEIVEDTGLPREEVDRLQGQLNSTL